MHYKTIILELLTQRATLHRQLCRERRLSTVLDCYASELKRRHESWVRELSRTNPTLDPIQTMSTAMELALRETEDHLLSAFPLDGTEAATAEA